MRIAITGTHGSGKSTLLEDFLKACPDYHFVQEPYWELVQEGTPMSDIPSLDGFVAQLEKSGAMILETKRLQHIIYDRCPLDFLSYTEAIAEFEGVDWSPTGRQLSQTEAALASLDLIALLPLTDPDEIATAIEEPELRRDVDDWLKRIIREDVLGLAGNCRRVVELSGTPEARLRQLIEAVSHN